MFGIWSIFFATSTSQRDCRIFLINTLPNLTMNALRRSIVDHIRTKNNIIPLNLLDECVFFANSSHVKQKCQPLQTLPTHASFSTDSSSATLYSAVVFERLPVIMPIPPQWMIDYAIWQYQFQMKRYKILPKEFTDEKQTSDDPSQNAETKWQPQPRETPADISGNRSTTLRRLDQRIFMLLQREENHWEFPHVEISKEETTRAAAERALKEAIGDHHDTPESAESAHSVQPFFIGNAPAGHVPSPQGTTMFFHRCQLIQGKPRLPQGSKYTGMVWVAKDELAEYIKDEKTLDVLQKML